MTKTATPLARRHPSKGGLPSRCSDIQVVSVSPHLDLATYIPTCSSLAQYLSASPVPTTMPAVLITGANRGSVAAYNSTLVWAD